MRRTRRLFFVHASTMSDTELINGFPADYWNASKVHILIAGSIFLIVLTVFTIALRFYARISSRAPLWWDDWFALATVVSGVYRQPHEELH
jgi:hypothetical protein